MKVLWIKAGFVLAGRYCKLQYKCILNKSDSIVDLENHLLIVLSNYTNSWTEIESFNLIRVGQICGSTIQSIVNINSFVFSSLLFR